MTATEKLRKLLDERGVEWANNPMMSVNGMERGTIFDASDGRWVRVIEALDETLCASHLTPEQVIAVTFGNDTCHIEGPRTSDTLEHDCPEFILYCGECGHGFGYIHYGENGNAWTNEPPKFCPNCGRKTAHWRERQEES